MVVCWWVKNVILISKIEGKLEPISISISISMWLNWGIWEAHFRNYRHYVINVPSAPWTDYPISLTRHGLTQAKVHSLAKWIAVGGNRTAIACVTIEVHDHYATAPDKNIARLNPTSIFWPWKLETKLCMTYFCIVNMWSNSLAVGKISTFYITENINTKEIFIQLSINFTN